MNPFLLSMVFLTIKFCEITSIETAVIQTASGKVQGEVDGTRLPGKYVQKFTNIPYAEAPVGKLRFAKPVAKKPWNGTLKYSNVSIACWQRSVNNSGVKLTEDCLILNVWTPWPQKTNQSVMVWIYGGSFQSGWASIYQGSNFVAVGDVILVTINYRLSVLGFLATGDERIKGNFGLFDQRLAMKWVKENIASFGGNPQSITIFGESAGGASVSAHTLSKKSWPYFDKAILESGGMNMPWSISSKQAAKDVLGIFLDSVNCTDTDELLECLQSNITEGDLKRLFISEPSSFGAESLGPYVDSDFFTNHPITLMKNGTIKPTAILLGVTKDDGFLSNIPALLKVTRNINVIKMAFEKHLKSFPITNSSKTVWEKALELYQPECTPSFVEAIRPMVDFQTDYFFICSAISEATLRSQLFPSTNVYVYRYSYVSPVFDLANSYPQGTFGFAEHASEVRVVFGLPINNPIFPAEDQILSARMILYWTNFAKNGDPNVGITKFPIAIDGIDSLPKWPKFINSTREYLDMESLSRMTVRNRLREKHCEFLSDPEAFIEKEGTATTTAAPTSIAVKQIAQMKLLLFVLLQVIF